MSGQLELDRLRRYAHTQGGRLYAGAVAGGLIFADPQHALLVLGPPRSGKTSAVAIPNVLAAPGAVVTTSIKPDVLAATVPSRAEMGRCWLLDPTGSIQVDPLGVTRLRWSPVAAASTWDESLVIARSMTGAARPSGRLGDSAHWTERAEALLGPLLHAAWLSGADMETVLRWTLRQEDQPAQTVLHAHGVQTAADVLGGISARDRRELSGIWSSLAGVLAAYRSDSVLDNSSGINFDPAGFVRSNDTVYVCAPARHQELAAPIVVAFLEQVRAAAYSALSEVGAAVPAAPQVTMVLDELANIAPLPDLPGLVAEGGGQGVMTVGCLQDLSQARVRWGAAADGFLSLFGAKLVLPGIGDLSTLELVSRLGGEIDLPTRTVSRASPWGPGMGAATVSWSTTRQRRIPAEAVNQLPRGTALLLSGSRPPENIPLPPWWLVEPFARTTRARALEPRSAEVRTLGW
ncbi:MAG TPA: type IV secretory system conjugative DNA transfer family protein [Acidimicrobiales bacterium]|nr:type IV secretory system conjugative DNA transfer family protein [Acidimicrobiales bacterium]